VEIARDLRISNDAIVSDIANIAINPYNSVMLMCVLPRCAVRMHFFPG
jgi:hypothetical protein